MKRLNLLTLFLISWSVIMAEGRVSLKFYDGSFEQLKEKALEEHKPFFISFHTSWSTPCQNMALYTYTNQELMDYVNENYLAFRVDAESIDRSETQLAQTYNVMFFPTIIIFDDHGEVQQRFSGFKNAAALKSQLMEHYKVKDMPEVEPETETKAESPLITDITPKATVNPKEEVKPATVPAKETKPATVPIPAPATPAVKATTTTAKAKTATKINSDVGLFKISLTQDIPLGYGVQVGVFGEYGNVLREVSMLEVDYSMDVMVHISKLKGKEVFKIVVGPFDSSAQANGFKKVFEEREKRQTMVVSLDRYQ